MPNYSKEIWKDIQGYESAHQISNKGRWRTLDRMVPAGNNKFRFSAGQIRRPLIASSGYRTAVLRKNGKQVIRYIHRLVLETFIGPCPKGMECLHKDGNRANNKLNNLRWGTRSENVWDSIKHKTYRGARKLTEQQVIQIKFLRTNQGKTCKELAVKFGVDSETIRDIINGRSWKSVV